MSDDGRGTAQPRGARGGSTSQDGTPFPVDTGLPRGALLTYALLLAGPLIWSAHFFLVYFVSELGCTADGGGLEVFDAPVPTVFTVVTTAVAALACLATAWWAHRRARHDDKPTVLRAGALLSLLGFVTVLFVGAPAVVFPPCG